MIITSARLELNASHQRSEQTVERERLRIWHGNPDPTARTPAPEARAQALPQFSQQAHALQPVTARLDTPQLDEETGPLAETRMQALVRMIEAITGRKIQLFDPRELHGKAAGQDAPRHTANGPAQAPRRSGFGLEYDYYRARIEEEQTHFAAEGVVRTADGREISVALELNMSRRFVEEQRISLRAGDAALRLKDPLVLNFSGNAAELSETRFSFDLDNDGREEQVALLGSDSGFLALDRNGDGAINNGSELFGALSGNGFADLAAHDADGNGWVDEADPIYSRLRIWSPDAAGHHQLVGLGQRGVGAIYLGHVASPFDLTTAGDNRLLGRVASSGIFLNENGTPGTLQQLDLVV